jgi:hypothetical protein
MLLASLAASLQHKTVKSLVAAVEQHVDLVSPPPIDQIDQIIVFL